MRRILLLFEFERLKQSAAIFTAECLRSCNMAPLGWAAAASAPERENQWLAFPPQAQNWARWSPSRPAWHQCSGQVDQHHPSPPAWGAALGTRDRGANKGASNRRPRPLRRTAPLCAVSVFQEQTFGSPEAAEVSHFSRRRLSFPLFGENAALASRLPINK